MMWCAFTEGRRVLQEADRVHLVKIVTAARRVVASYVFRCGPAPACTNLLITIIVARARAAGICVYM